MSAEFDRALAIVLSKIADTPTLLNSLPHDILRKLILCVGTLDQQQDIQVGYSTCKLEKLIDALKRYSGELFKCDQCGLMEIAKGYPNMLKQCYFDCNILVCEDCSHICQCERCENRICNNCWPKSRNGCCKPCDSYDEDADCVYCASKSDDSD